MNLNALRIAATFAGCFLGAGCVSGQEIFQFFASYGLRGVWGLLLSMGFIFLFGVLIFRLSARCGTGDCGVLVIRRENKTLRAVVGVLETVLLVGICMIMTAGVAALFEQIAGVSKYLTSALFCTVIFALSLGGHARMTAFFSMTVPLLVVFTAAVGAAAYFRFPLSNLKEAAQHAPHGNPLTGSVWFSAAAYAAYNLFGSIEILGPIGQHVKSSRRACFGVALGTGMLLLITLCIFFAMSLCPDAPSAQLPMLYVADRISPLFGILYALLLTLGMMGACLSSAVAALHYLGLKLPVLRRERFTCSAVFMVLIYIGSLFGFGNLIGTVYPLFGYLGIAALLCMLEHFFHLSRAEKGNKKTKKHF